MPKKNRKPAWCYYNNDPVNGKKYGKLYNWYAVDDSRGLAPKGWHIPLKDEWDELEQFIGKDQITKKIKTKNERGKYDPPYTDNGFSALPGGQRYEDSEFDHLGSQAVWWTADPVFFENFETDEAVSISLSTYFFTSDNVYKGQGLSVRCIKN